MIDFIVISEKMNFTFGLLDYDGYIRDIVKPWIVKSWFCSIQLFLTVTLASLRNVNRYIGNIVISKIVILGFHCIGIYKANFSSEYVQMHR